MMEKSIHESNKTEIEQLYKYSRSPRSQNIAAEIFKAKNNYPGDDGETTTVNVKHHEQLCKELNGLYRKKNHDYGDSFHKSYEEWGLPMAAIRLEDKLNRLKTLCRKGAQVQDESVRDTLMDLANYSIMTIMELEGDNDEKSE